MNCSYLAPWTVFLAVAFALVPFSVTRLGGQTPARSGVIALKGATLVTVTRGTIPNGTIGLRDGKITAMAPGCRTHDVATAIGRRRCRSRVR